MSADAESKRVADVAAKYRDAGYQVTVHPSARDLPAFLHGHQPDLLARRGDENVIVEVKTSANRSVLDRYQALAERIREEPGWRFDLVLSPPANQLSEVPEYPLLGPAEARVRFDEAEKLLASGYADAALLLAWAAVEGLLRGLAEREDVALPRQTTGSVLNSLLTLGAISRSDYEQLRLTLSQRSAVAHGFEASGVETSARDLIGLGYRLMAERDRAA